MSIFFNYNSAICTEGSTPSPFSFDPSVLSLKELLMHEIKHLSYYIIKLSDLGVETSELKDKVVNFISLVIMNLDFKREEFNYIIEDLKENRKELENQYINLCNKQGINAQTLTPSYSLDEKKTNLVSAINRGEQQSLIRNTTLSKTKKNLHEIMMNLIQNACLFLVEIDSYGESHKKGKDAVIKLLNTSNFPAMPDEKWNSKIIEFSKINFDIMHTLQNKVLEHYGPVQEKEVDVAFKAGNAILVSGHCYKDLEDLLKATENQDINIYTHNDMLIAHSLTFFNKYPHLVGHYQKSADNMKLDFATFPGVILITKNSQPQIDIIRGRIFTLDKYPAFGISKLEDNNFEPLIEKSRELGGFKNEVKIKTLKVGYNKEYIIKKVENIISRIKSGEIKHLFMIDLLNQYPYDLKYTQKLFEILPDDYYAISLSYNSHKENIWHVDSFYSYSLAYYILEELTKNFDMSKLKFTMFLTQCNIHTISHIFNLKDLGIQSIYLGNCCPSVINPSLIKGLNELFEVQYMSPDAQNDLNDIIQKFSDEK